jgi:anti-anti-sigma factor
MTYLNVLRVTVESVEDACLLRVSGEVDASTASELRGYIRDARNEQDTVLVDLSEVDFMDSTGLRVLLDASRSSAMGKWEFFIVRPSATVRRLIELTATAGSLPLVEPDSRVLG